MAALAAGGVVAAAADGGERLVADGAGAVAGLVVGAAADRALVVGDPVGGRGIDGVPRPPPPIVAEWTPAVTELSAIPPITFGLWLVPSEAGSIRRPRALLTRRLSGWLSVVPRKSEPVVPALPASFQKPLESIPSRVSALGTRPRVASSRSAPVRLLSVTLDELTESEARSAPVTWPSAIFAVLTALAPRSETSLAVAIFAVLTALAPRSASSPDR